MIAQGIIGGKLYNGQNDLYETHKTMGKSSMQDILRVLHYLCFHHHHSPIKKLKVSVQSSDQNIVFNIHFSAMVITNVVADDNRKAHWLLLFILHLQVMPQQSSFLSSDGQNFKHIIYFSFEHT